jgi:molybdopterin-biosynthesis enzyme MoeA-like protein
VEAAKLVEAAKVVEVATTIAIAVTVARARAIVVVWVGPPSVFALTTVFNLTPRSPAKEAMR